MNLQHLVTHSIDDQGFTLEGELEVEKILALNCLEGILT